MTTGLRVWDAAGTLTFDSNAPSIGICMGVYTYAANASATLTFPELAGRSMIVRYVLGGRVQGFTTVDYALGYPRINVPAQPSVRVFSAWAQ